MMWTTTDEKDCPSLDLQPKVKVLGSSECWTNDHAHKSPWKPQFMKGKVGFTGAFIIFPPFLLACPFLVKSVQGASQKIPRYGKKREVQFSSLGILDRLLLARTSNSQAGDLVSHEYIFEHENPFSERPQCSKQTK